MSHVVFRHAPGPSPCAAAYLKVMSEEEASLKSCTSEFTYSHRLKHQYEVLCNLNWKYYMKDYLQSCTRCDQAKQNLLGAIPEMIQLRNAFLFSSTDNEAAKMKALTSSYRKYNEAAAALVSHRITSVRPNVVFWHH